MNILFDNLWYPARYFTLLFSCLQRFEWIFQVRSMDMVWNCLRIPNLEILIKNIVFAFSLSCIVSIYVVCFSVLLSLLFTWISFFLSRIYGYTYFYLLIVERTTLWIITCLISSLHPCFHKKHTKTNLRYQHYFQINHFNSTKANI